MELVNTTMVNPADVLEGILSSYFYNRDTEYMAYLCIGIKERMTQKPILNIKRIKDFRYISDDVDNIYGSLVCLFGDYGTSPRYGWIEIDTAPLIKVLDERYERYLRLAKEEDDE